MAQAHRIKIDPAVLRAGVFRFLNRLARESGFWLLAVLALGMIAALASFNPADPAWTHTTSVARLHNLGGVPGAWFADMMLYFFGYPAYLLPLGIAFSGWQLFKRGGLLALDGEIVLLRALGFAVVLATACGLAALHGRVIPGTVPGDGTAGGLVGIHVGRFLTQAFGFNGGNLFMVALLLAGVMLATGASWLTILDEIGAGMLRLLDGVGSLALAPLRWLRPGARARSKAVETPTADAGDAVTPGESGPVADHGVPPPPPLARRRARGWLSDAGQAAFTATSAWWTTHHPVGQIHSPEPIPEPTDSTPPGEANVAEEAASPGNRSGRIEPVLNWSMTENKPALTPAGVVAAVPLPEGNPVLEAPYLDMQTLLPTTATPPPVMSPAPAAPLVMPPSPSVQTPWQPGEGFAVDSPTPLPVAPARRVAAPLSMPCRLPALTLLDPPPPCPDRDSPEILAGMSRQVERLLKGLGLVVRVIAVEPGPVVTRIEIEPASGIKASQISLLAQDLARGLRVSSVRVVEVIPGKALIGLEIPNRQRKVITLHEVLDSPVYSQSTAPLTLALGQDVSGYPVVANLHRMPHLLVAGMTGSGLPVVIHTLLLSLLYKASPAEMRLILVDSQRRELGVYEGIPHLLTPVVTNGKAAVDALRWAVGEVEHRYRLMATAKVRNIAGFNRKVLDARVAGEEGHNPGGTLGDRLPGQPLPFIVVVIAELAELMGRADNPGEEGIARLAQKGQAVGIHLIPATQQPSAAVITGLIKANIPTRIALRVASSVDACVILDQAGAERLLDDGDLLYLPPGTDLPQRIHGASVNVHEVGRVVDHLRQAGAPDEVDVVLTAPP